MATHRSVSNSALRGRTGHGWDAWFAILDAWDGPRDNHTRVARWLVNEHRLDNWSAQTITVDYQRARGLREVGQQSSGAYVANVTRTVGVPVERLYEAFADPRVRRRWLPDTTLRVRPATAPTSWRADWLDDGTRVTAGFTAKGPAKSEVSVVHEKLNGAEAVAERKAYWRDRLAVLKGLLEP